MEGGVEALLEGVMVVVEMLLLVFLFAIFPKIAGQRIFVFPSNALAVSGMSICQRIITLGSLGVLVLCSTWSLLMQQKQSGTWIIKVFMAERSLWSSQKRTERGLMKCGQKEEQEDG